MDALTRDMMDLALAGATALLALEGTGPRGKTPARPCRDEDGQFAACGTGGSTAGSDRRQAAAKRRRLGGPTRGIGSRTRAHQRRMRGRRRRSREEWERDVNADHAALTAEHQQQRVDLAQSIRAERAERRRDVPRERRELAQAVRQERAELRADQAKDRKRLRRDQEREAEALDRRQGRQHERLTDRQARQRERRGDSPELRAAHAEERAELVAAQRDEEQELHGEHRQARRDLREQQRADRESARTDHRDQIEAHRDSERERISEQHRDHRELIHDLHTDQRLERAQLHQNLRYDDRHRAGKAWQGKAGSPGDEIPAALDLAERAAERIGLLDGWRDGTLSELEEWDLLRSLRHVARAVLRDWAADLVEEFNPNYVRRTKGIGAALKAGVGRFFDRTRKFVRELFVAGALALNGPHFVVDDNKPVNDAVATLVVEQEQYLKAFETETMEAIQRAEAEPEEEQKPPLDGRFVSRAEQYGASVYGGTSEIKRRKFIAEGRYKEERRVLGLAEHCEDCPPIADLGWRPIGTLPRLGFKNEEEPSQCRVFCECHWQFR